MTAQPGDIVLYNGSNICIFYSSNSWSYTRLGKIDNLSESELRTFLNCHQEYQWSSFGRWSILLSEWCKS